MSLAFLWPYLQVATLLQQEHPAIMATLASTLAMQECSPGLVRRRPAVHVAKLLLSCTTSSQIRLIKITEYANTHTYGRLQEADETGYVFRPTVFFFVERHDFS